MKKHEVCSHHETQWNSLLWMSSSAFCSSNRESQSLGWSHGGEHDWKKTYMYNYYLFAENSINQFIINCAYFTLLPTIFQSILFIRPLSLFCDILKLDPTIAPSTQWLTYLILGMAWYPERKRNELASGHCWTIWSPTSCMCFSRSQCSSRKAFRLEMDCHGRMSQW